MFVAEGSAKELTVLEPVPCPGAVLAALTHNDHLDKVRARLILALKV